MASWFQRLKTGLARTTTRLVDSIGAALGRKRVDAADGSHHHVWHGQKNDHADDCEAMAVVMATALGLTGAETMDTPALTLAPT